MSEHAVVVADTSGAITHWNPGAEALFGHRAENAAGHSLDLIVPEPLPEAHWAGFTRDGEPAGQGCPDPAGHGGSPRPWGAPPVCLS